MHFFIRLGLFFLLSLTTLSAVVRIMPLGNSITYDERYSDLEGTPRPIGVRTAYRSHLWYMLEQAGYPADFVGSQIAGQDVEPPFDPENEGHPGWTSYEIAERTYEYMSNSMPDVVLLHIGTNDRTTTNPEGVDQILNEIDQYELNSDHHIKVFVALIIDRQSPDGRIKTFNERLQLLLEDRIARGDDIVIVDMYHNAGLTSSDYADNTHPNDQGYYKMAVQWYNALLNNPYDPNGAMPSRPPVALEDYPASLVSVTYIESVEIIDNTVTFLVNVPDTGIVF